MVSENGSLNKTVEKSTRRRQHCYAVAYVQSGVLDSVELFWDYRKAKKYQSQLRSDMSHPDYDDTVVLRLELPN